MRHAIVAALLCLLAACTARPARVAVDIAALEREVAATETAFAQTMVDRDFDAFARYVAEDAVFLNGGDVLRGKPAILAFWRKFYAEPAAPFTWKPDLVAVLPTGDIAQSIGPVAGPDGKVASRFYSTWRREADGRWLVVLDDGYKVCP
jgi:uncharacterized protein (TIGR02246 family)